MALPFLAPVPELDDVVQPSRRVSLVWFKWLNVLRDLVFALRDLLVPIDAYITTIHDVHAYGAEGDGVTDDRAAIQAAAAAAGPGGTVTFRADHTYRIASGIVLAYDDQTWWMYGATIAVDFVGAGITLGTAGIRIFRCKVFGPTVQPASGVLDWTAGGCGIRLLSCTNCTIRDPFVRWLEKGIEITSPVPPNQTETTQNWIVRPLVASCADSMVFYAEDGGTVNENQVFAGQLGYSGSDPSAVGRYCVKIHHHATSLGNVNGIKFFGTYLGNSKVVNRPNAIYLDGVGCLFSGVHAENFPDPRVTPAGDALLGFLPNYFWGSSADWLDPEADLAAGTTGNLAPWVYSGQDGAGVAGGGQAGSDYVWRAKQLGATTKVTLSVADNTNAEVFSVTGDGSARSARGGIGYATGAGGTVIQATNKATAVTLNKVTGLITMNNAALNAGVIVSFVLNDSLIAATDLIAITHESGGTLGAYTVNARATGAGTAAIDIRNNTAGNLSEALVLRFAVLKSVNA